MSLLGKILRSSTAVDQKGVSDDNANINLLEEFRPASVGVVSANSTDFISLRRSYTTAQVMISTREWAAYEQ